MELTVKVKENSTLDCILSIAYRDFSVVKPLQSWFKFFWQFVSNGIYWYSKTIILETKAQCPEATCVIAADPHFYTFDLGFTKDLTFQGHCSYYLTKTYDLPKSDPNWISIEAALEPRNVRPGATYLNYITVKLANGDEIVLRKGKQITVSLEGPFYAYFNHCPYFNR